MRLVLQRSSSVEVWIDGDRYSASCPGLLILFGTRRGDQPGSCGYLADKAVNLRIFEDDQARMNLSVLDTGGDIMVVSQFTLYADCHKGRRPGFSEALAPEKAEPLYDRFVQLVAASGLKVATGRFGAKMEVKFSNLGPVTIILDHDQ